MAEPRSSNLRVDKDFAVPDPTPAKFFAFLSEEEYRAGEWQRIFARWRDEGVQQSRVTIVNDEYPNDPYPHGIWLEGWLDSAARMLPFGAGYPDGGPMYPPLTKAPTTAEGS